MGMLQKETKIVGILMTLIELSSGVNLDPPKPYGTATIYDWSFSSAGLIQRNLETWAAPSKCSPLQVLLATRHGSRNPTTANIVSAQSLINRIRGKIQAPQYQDLNTWIVPFEISTQHQLVNLGRDEMEKMGIRFGKRFRNLFSNLSSTDPQFISSDKSWTTESAASFKGGVGSELGTSLNQNIQTRNDLLRFYTMCPKYTRTVVENQEWKTKQDTFENGEEVNNLRRTMSNRLNLQGISELTLDELSAMYLMMVFEEGLLGSSSWSKVWQTREELAIMEYIQDFRTYYEWSYGYPITAEMACILLKELLTNMDKAVSENNKNSRNFPKGVFAFGHTPSIVPLLTLLGFYKDSTGPLASNFAQNANRQFHTHKIDHFGSNVAIVLYTCEVGLTNESPPAGYEWPSSLSKYMVQVFLQEQPITLSGTEYNLIPYETFRQKYINSINNCNFDEICDKISVDPQSTNEAKKSDFNVLLLVSLIAMIFLK